MTGDDGRLLQIETLEKGWAKVYVFENLFKRLDRFAEVQRDARSRHLGVWSRCAGDFQ